MIRTTRARHARSSARNRASVKFRPLFSGAAMSSERGYPWFCKLHFRAPAHWSEVVCILPDQATARRHEPEEFDQLDKWLISALRYLRHEFEIYADRRNFETCHFQFVDLVWTETSDRPDHH